MKHFAVEVKRTSYVTIHVEANTKEQAEELAWAEIESGESYGISDDANWGVEDIYEQFATDNTRSYGPQGEAA
jgi:hypothetical protein